jgi:flagellar basal body rod protein FlgG
MPTGELVLASALNALADQQDLIAANLANMDSAAYKRRVGSFAALLNARSPAAPALLGFRHRADFRQGDITQTGSDNHLAIQGDGFLAVRGPQGQTFYSRAGEMHLNRDGVMVNGDGLPLLADNDQSVQFTSQNSVFKIDGRGRVLDGSGEVRARLPLVRFTEPQRLVPQGGGLFAAPDDLQPLPDQDSVLQQGHLERSNTDAVAELIAMIKVQRSFQSVTKVLAGIQQVDESLIQSTR